MSDCTLCSDGACPYCLTLYTRSKEGVFAPPGYGLLVESLLLSVSLSTFVDVGHEQVLTVSTSSEANVDSEASVAQKGLESQMFLGAA